MAGDFGTLVLLMLVLLMLVGAAIEAGSARRVPSARMRRRVGIAAVVVACLVPLAAFTSVAFSERGIGDRISELTSETKVAPQQGGGRVFAASSSRGKYWREAWRVFKARPAEGVGAGRVRRRAAQGPQRHLGHAPRARLVRADTGRLRTRGAGPHDAPVPHLGDGGAQRDRAAAAPPPARRGRGTRPAPARLGRAPHRARDGPARAGRVRRAVAARLDLVHPRARSHGTHRGRVRGRPRPARLGGRGGRRDRTGVHAAARRGGGSSPAWRRSPPPR